MERQPSRGKGCPHCVVLTLVPDETSLDHDRLRLSDATDRYGRVLAVHALLHGA